MTDPRRVAKVSIAGLSASGLSFIVFVAAGRGLEADHFADFGAVWGLFFGAAAVLSAIELEASRQAAEGEELADLAGATLVLSALALILGSALTPAIQPMLSLHRPAIVWVVIVGLSAFPLFFFGRGVLAGTDRLESYAVLSLAEGALRSMALLIPIGAVIGYVVAMVAGPAVVIPLLVIRLPWPFSRLRWAPIRRQLMRLVPLFSGNVAGALLITGLPATATVALGDADEVGLAIAVALSMVSRFPLVLLQSVYGLLVPWFLKRTPPSAVRSKPLMAILLSPLVLLIGALVTFIGARVVVGVSPRLNLPIAGVYFFGAFLLGALQIATARLVSLQLRSVVQAMWWSAALLAIGAMVISRFVEFDTVRALGIAQLVGPAAGLAVFIARIKSTRAGGLHADA